MFRSSQVRQSRPVKVGKKQASFKELGNSALLRSWLTCGHGESGKLGFWEVIGSGQAGIYGFFNLPSNTSRQVEKPIRSFSESNLSRQVRGKDL